MDQSYLMPFSTLPLTNSQYLKSVFTTFNMCVALLIFEIINMFLESGSKIPYFQILYFEWYHKKPFILSSSLESLVLSVNTNKYLSHNPSTGKDFLYKF